MASGSGRGILESFMRDISLKSLFSGGSGRRKVAEDDPAPIPQLSPIANSVVSRCSRILLLSTEKLQQCFETELPAEVKQPTVYARHLLEYCCYKALQVLTDRPEYLADKDFHRLTYDMMLAWEAPGEGNKSLSKGTTSCNHLEVEDEDGASLFYTNSTCIAVQVDDKKTVGLEAFARIASACPAIADLITVHNLCDALTISSSGQLHFLIYDKYLKSLDKVLKSAKCIIWSPLASSLHLSDGEMILDVDGVMPTQSVLQHVGISAWPGRLTITTHALYFESLGVGSYDKALRYDLAADLKQVVKRELTGPLGARLFDKAVMYKSTSLAEPVYFEFPEFKGHSRRDYWLAIIQEVLQVHRFIRKFNLEEIQQGEVLSMAALGIFRYRAVKEGFHITPHHFKMTLAFNLAEKLPKGDIILDALYNHLELLHTGCQSHFASDSSSDKKLRALPLPSSSYTLSKMGLLKRNYMINERDFLVADVCIGATSPLEMAVKESFCYSERAEAACATVDQVKVEGIDRNIAVMQELLYPVVESGKWLHFLATWEDPFRSTFFLVLILYLAYRDWVRYILPCIFLSLAVLMLWHKYCSKRKPLGAFQIKSPPTKNAVEQLLTLQDAIAKVEILMQAGNIILLKLRSLLFAAIPKATDKVAFALIMVAALIAIVSFKHLIILVVLEAYSREMPLRKKSSDKLMRRLKE
ncbi:uncharacterized protein LOC103714805 isoform X1 [Phoenix dactylifera]|uniref:Uncharacterized protein LOC103714805 isoform X1 n=1 Tax=Phoenix dactylifera TaxID=42345 RepID=A0A8B8ZFC6_PHODC|nr:uncharacterized protein LOC103714805 isoform X1 [Phoenix dactylifera]